MIIALNSARACTLWMVGLFYKGTQKGLEIIDLYKTLDDDKSTHIGDALEKNWNNEVARAKAKNSEPSLMRALSKTFFWNYMFYGLLLFLQMAILRSIQPVVLSNLIKQFTSVGEETQTYMYIFGSILVAISILVVFLMHHTNFALSVIGMRVRIGASSLVYRKITKLNQNSLGQTAAGQVVNLLSNDVNRFDLVVLFLHYLWIMPFQVALITYFLWDEVGVSCLAGILSMALLTLPVQGYLGKLTGALRLAIANKTDRRVKIMSEVISERTTLFLTVICFVLLGNIIRADIVFSMAQFFNILQASMAIFYPMAISYGAEAWVSVKRLEKFLILEEKVQSNIEAHVAKKIQLTNISASWVPHSIVLKEIDITIPPNTLCAVVGPVGAGKSSLLQLLLGELPPSSGKIYMGGELSYSAQEPWLFASTVRNNILFGQHYNKFLYNNVVKVCALESDFRQFPYGDKTIVGERGVSLSGGQRARINLARAVYRKADIYLLDDPLSAVDAHVGKHLFEQCIVNYLEGTTRILVTHQLQYLKKADLIVVINDLLPMKLQKKIEKDEVELDASYEIRRQSVLSIANSTLSETIEIAHMDNENEEETGADSGISPFKEYFKATRSVTEQEELRYSNNSIMIVEYSQPIAERTELYDLNRNNLSSFYNTYTGSISENSDLLRITTNNIFDKVQVNDKLYSIFKTEIAMYIYGALIIAAIVITLARSLVFFNLAMRSSTNLHSKMFNALLKAPMRFFDTNPSGRVLNRFSKDMGAIDEILPRITLVMIGILINVGISNPYVIIAMVVLGAVFIKLRNWYIQTAKDIKHLEGITKSPVFSHVTSSLNGITTIRASKAEEVLIHEFDHHQDAHTSAWYLTITCIVAFGLWLDIVCVIFVACVTFSFVVLTNFTTVSGSLAGLAISQSLILTGMLQYGMRQTADVINQLTSVERVLQYTTIETEGPFETPPDAHKHPMQYEARWGIFRQLEMVQSYSEKSRFNKNNQNLCDVVQGKIPALQWPSNGLIQFKNLCLRYVKDDPLVLNNLNFTIQPGEKVGIVGRTGAGKSSLISALFRLTPLEGNIYIDGVDTQKLGLNFLRKHISIIPQEPVLFSATLRYNLDPFNEFDDSKLWNALDEVELKDAVTSLDFMVSEGGSNFSLGQRQLVCLARAILRNNKILVLDEATANVDPRTDSFIQATIRRKFKDCTVLTIAHRLNTVMDSDKVMVMSAGSMLEFDHPYVLLQNSDGHLYQLVQQTGPRHVNATERHRTSSL
ncbi:hypothetical protein NQ317_005348 [Molorchus minor]|uniref:Uncharacterized protein n=1 Tax=Molorchus minor TaxID=1323400 RepID=A0ABQ9JRB4_9CUCU|nr:hypothetical protein NQ317_005348 [Molorchus minor]